MSDPEATRSALRRLFASQRLAVLATHDADGQPYANLMTFAATEDLKSLMLATSRSTRKYANLKADPRVALLIDNREHEPSDIREAAAATVLGDAEEVAGAQRDRLLRIYLDRNPHMAEFASAPTSALFQVHVRSTYLVRRFQEVTEFHVER